MNLEEMKSIRLDVGCGENKQEGFVGMDARLLKGVDIVHNVEEFPWPLPDNCCSLIVCSHLVEHIKPEFSIAFMDECWRVLKAKGDLAVSTPYPGSRGYWQDPTHCNGWNEATWQYFDPTYPLWTIYKPKPWKIREGFPVWQVQGNMEIVLSKRSEEDTEAAQDLSGPALGISVADEIQTQEKVGG